MQLNEWELDTKVCSKVYQEIRNNGYDVEFGKTKTGTPVTMFYEKKVVFPPPWWQAHSAIHELAHIMSWPVLPADREKFEALAYMIQVMVCDKVGLIVGTELRNQPKIWLLGANVDRADFIKEYGVKAAKITNKIVSVCLEE